VGKGYPFVDCAFSLTGRNGSACLRTVPQFGFAEFQDDITGPDW